MSLVFPQHGSYSLEVKGSILVTHLWDAWNIETAMEFSSDFKCAASTLVDTPWGHLVLLDDWETGTPEIESVIVDLVEWCREHNLTRIAHVYSRSAFIQTYIDKVVVEKQGQFIRHAFSNEQSAVNWLAEEGFSFDTQTWP